MKHKLYLDETICGGVDLFLILCSKVFSLFEKSLSTSVFDIESSYTHGMTAETRRACAEECFRILDSVADNC